MKNTKVLKGGEFLVSESVAEDIFIPEEFSEEQKMISGMCNDFLKQEVCTSDRFSVRRRVQKITIIH